MLPESLSVTCIAGLWSDRLAKQEAALTRPDLQAVLIQSKAMDHQIRSSDDIFGLKMQAALTSWAPWACRAFGLKVSPLCQLQPVIAQGEAEANECKVKH